MNNGNISNQSTEKALAVLEFLASQPKPLKLLEIAKMMDMNASTVSRYLSALQSCGYVCQDQVNARYYASTKICELANKLLSRFQLVPFAHSYVQKVSEYFGETSCLSVERNYAALYIDIVVNSSSTLMNIQRVGNSAPLYCTASGKLFLSRYSEQELDNYIAKKPLTKFTDTTITTKQALIQELDRIRSRGYSYDNGENESGLTCVAYPIFSHYNDIIACISVTGPSTRFTVEVIEEKRPFLAEVVSDLSKNLASLGYFNI